MFGYGREYGLAVLLEKCKVLWKVLKNRMYVTFICHLPLDESNASAEIGSNIGT